MKTSYSDGTICLRLMTEEDTDNIVKWRNSDGVRTHFIYQKLFTRQSHEQWIENMVKPGKVVQMIICECEQTALAQDDGSAGKVCTAGRPIGSVYIRDIDSTHNKGEYGIFIGEADARGKGIGTRAAKLMIRYAFKELKLHRLFLRVFADNTQAIGSYEKAGFVKEAYLKDDVCIDGVYRDIVLMAILNDKSR